MTPVNAAYISALEARDIRRYPSEIAKIPERDSVVRADTDRGLTFSQIATAVVDETPAVPITSPAPRKAQPDKRFTLWEKEEFGFGDFVDIINPLQHIPIVATIYRNMTGDKIGLAPRVIGGAIWGRVGGFVSGVVNAIVDWFTGKDIGDHIFSALFGKPVESGNGVALAQSIKPGNKTSAPETATGQLDSEATVPTASWQNPFAFEDRFAELTGHLTVPAATGESRLAKPETPVAPTNISALSSYERNSEADESLGISKVRYIA